MARQTGDDETRYTAARRLHARHQPLWLVLWGAASRRYIAFYQGDADVTPLTDTTPHGLDARIRQAQAVIARTRPHSYWHCPVRGCAWTSITPTPHAPCPGPREAP
ncbi:hypothetical protein [Nocardiopsis sp. LOL_012]|uniref:hypothetical protein n=1 Tax=Nocardiopsis sp. LOL_012 TaxID=3345409 RepID=UPI003A86991D